MKPFRPRPHRITLFVSEITTSRLATLGIHSELCYDGERRDATLHENVMTFSPLFLFLLSFSLSRQVPRDLSYRRATILARDFLRAACCLLPSPRFSVRLSVFVFLSFSLRSKSAYLSIYSFSSRTRVIREHNDKPNRSRVRSRCIATRARSADVSSSPQI